MPTNLWKSVNYKTQIKYFINTYIREYDLSKANINSLLYEKVISQEEYNRLLNLPKMDREIEIGLMIRNNYSIYKSIQNGIIEAKRRLSYANNIEDYEVVSIKNDAMFIHGRLLDNLIFPPFEFKIKNEYTMYMQLQELEVYYGDIINPDGSISTNIDIKGINDDKLLLHQNGMLDLICEACYRMQRQDPLDTLVWISDIYEKYIKRELPKEYYRNFDVFSQYTINTVSMSIPLDYIKEENKKDVNIDRNLMILRNLFGIISNVYSTRNKRQ